MDLRGNRTARTDTTARTGNDRHVLVRKEERMTRTVLLIGAMTSIVVTNVSCKSAPKSSSDREEMREAVRQMERDTLSELYRLQPSAQRAVEGAAGHAVFSNFGLKIFVTGGGSGKGIAVRT